jgi:glycosyltransferase involved in cell wall biosynthesis
MNKKKILMAERSDLYHDARVQKEAESLHDNGYKLLVLGLRAARTSLDKDFPYTMITRWVLPRNYGFLRKLHLSLLILAINIRIIFIRSDYYHAHNTYFLPGMYIAKLIYGGVLVYDSHEVQWELNPIASFQERIFIKKVDKIINVSEGRARAQSQRFNISLNNICVISNYPVLLDTKDRKLLDDNSKIRFIFSGGLNLTDNKIDNFIRALEDFPKITLDFLAFGYSNSALIIKKLVQELGIEDRVKFLPLVKPNEVLATLTKYHYTVNLMINPNNLISINYHSINKIYESISAGLPILCSDLPAFKEEIVNNGIGSSVDPYSIISIKSGLELIVGNMDNHYPMRKKAFEIAKDKFNWDNEEKKLLEMYRNL